MSGYIEPHTPGDWRFVSWRAPDSGKLQFSLETADSQTGLGGIAPGLNASALLSDEQHEANARLMMAAPRLLASLQQMLTMANRLEELQPSMAYTLANAKQAVADATGEFCYGAYYPRSNVHKHATRR